MLGANSGSKADIPLPLNVTECCYSDLPGGLNCYTFIFKRKIKSKERIPMDVCAPIFFVAAVGAMSSGGTGEAVLTSVLYEYS